MSGDDIPPCSGGGSPGAGGGAGGSFESSGTGAGPGGIGGGGGASSGVAGTGGLSYGDAQIKTLRAGSGGGTIFLETNTLFANTAFTAAGGGGGSKGTFLTELALDLKPGEEKTLELTRGQYVNFIVNGQKHKAQFIGLIIGITSKYATFFIYSTKINKKVVEGEMVSVDVNGDNMDDLEITYLEKITNMKAKFKFKSLAGGVSPSVPEVPTMPQPLAVEAPPSPQIVTQPAEESQLPVQLPAYEAPAPVEKLFYETIVDKYGVEVISGMGVLLVVILLFVSVAKIRAKESKAKNFSDLVNYIQQVKQQGYRDTQIKEALIKSG